MLIILLLIIIIMMIINLMITAKLAFEIKFMEGSILIG